MYTICQKDDLVLGMHTLFILIRDLRFNFKKNFIVLPG